MALFDVSEEEEDETAAVLGQAVVFAGSPPSLSSISPSMRGIAALMPKVLKGLVVVGAGIGYHCCCLLLKIVT